MLPAPAARSDASIVSVQPPFAVIPPNSADAWGGNDRKMRRSGSDSDSFSAEVKGFMAKTRPVNAVYGPSVRVRVTVLVVDAISPAATVALKLYVIPCPLDAT